MRRFPVRLFAILNLVSLLVLVVLVHGGASAPALFRQAVQPFLGVGRASAEAAGAGLAWMRGVSRTETEFRRLRERVADLEARLVERERDLMLLSRQAREQHELTARLSGGASRWIPARVEGVDPSPWVRMIWVDRGLQDGVVEGAAVAAGEALVGRVAEAREFSARIQLLSDPASAAQVAVVALRGGAPEEPGSHPSEPAVRGVLRGTGGIRAPLDMVPNDQAVSAGAGVVTTGYDAKFPRGLFVGTVESARPGNIFHEIVVRLAADFEGLDVVQIRADRVEGGAAKSGREAPK